MNSAVVRHFGRSPRRGVDAHAGPAKRRSAEAAEAKQAPAYTPAPQPSVGSGAGESAFSTATLRIALVASSLSSVVITWFASADVTQLAEPELALLLRGMAAIKGLLATGAAGLVWWRLGQPVPLLVAATYIVCTWALFVSSALIWQLAFIPAAAVMFHVGGLIALVVALREGRNTPGFGRQTPNPSVERTF